MTRFAQPWAEVVDIRARMHAGGWSVVPVVENSKGPLFAGWPEYVYDRTAPEPPFPRTLNKRGEPTRIAHLGTGAKTVGIVAVDIDIDCSQRAHAARLVFEIAAGERAVIVRYREGSPRRLLVYRAAENLTQTSDSYGEGAAKLEIFANHTGRQVFLHGVHPSGAWLQYEVDGPEDVSVATLPILDASALGRATDAALAAAGIERRRTSHAKLARPRAPLKPFTGDLRPYARAAMLSECAAVAGCAKGARNETLYKATACLAALAAGGALPAHAVVGELLRAAHACGLVADKGLAAVERTIVSGLKRGRENPRALPPLKAGSRHAR